MSELLGTDIWRKRHEIDNARRKKMRDAMEEYDRTVYRPAMEELRKQCGEKGHGGRKYHDNCFGCVFTYCTNCGGLIEKDCA